MGNRVLPVYLGEQIVFKFQGRFQTRGQSLAVEQVSHSYAAAAHLIEVRRSNPAAGGPDGGGAAGFLFQSVQHDMVGHDDVGPFADVKMFGVNASAGQLVQLVQQRLWTDDHAVPDYSIHAGPADAGGHQVQLECALVVNHRMTGVIASGVTHDRVNPLGKIIDDLTLTFVSPLATNHGVRRHFAPIKLGSSPN